MQVQAKAKQLRTTARKIGLVAGLVRGRSVSDGLVILEHTPKRAAGLLAAVIKSAQANAEHNQRLKPEQLTIKAIEVGSGGVLKRARPGAFGRAYPNYHRLSNITVTLEAAETAPSKPKRATKEKA